MRGIADHLVEALPRAEIEHLCRVLLQGPPQCAVG
jgi:hypothetical protein